MGFDERSNEKILAEHGKWIARLRDDARVLEQRLYSLERRTSIFEVNLAELAKSQGKLKLDLTSLEDKLARLDSKFEAFGVQPNVRSRRI